MLLQVCSLPETSTEDLTSNAAKKSIDVTIRDVWPCAEVDHDCGEKTELKKEIHPCWSKVKNFQCASDFEYVIASEKGIVQTILGPDRR